mgnify:FL=1
MVAVCVKSSSDSLLSRAQILEIILGLSFKKLSNYVNHVVDTPLDDAFAPKAWKPVTTRLAG